VTVPLGEISWKQSSGPTKLVTVRLPVTALALLEIGARALGVSRHALISAVVERWVWAWLEEDAGEIAEERERRKEHA